MFFDICDKNDESMFDLNYNDSDQHASWQSSGLANKKCPYWWYNYLGTGRVLEQL